MNWYQKLAANNLRFNNEQEMFEQINRIIDVIIQKHMNLFSENEVKEIKSPVFVGTIQLSGKSSYNNNTEKDANIYLLGIAERGKAIGSRDKNDGNIVLNFDKFLINDKNKSPQEQKRTRIWYQNNLYHELTHGIDPKRVVLNRDYPGNRSNWPTEFDAYSKEIVEFVKNNPHKQNAVESWIYSDPKTEFPSKLGTPADENLEIWTGNNVAKFPDAGPRPDLVTKLKERLYTEIFSLKPHVSRDLTVKSDQVI